MNLVHGVCPECGIELSSGVALRNIPRNNKKNLTYPYMKEGESMHLECYVNKVVIECVTREISKLNE